MALSQILPSLFLSGADGADNALILSRKGITLIVNATLCHPSPSLPGVEVLRVPVSDAPSSRIDRHFDRVGERIHGNRGGKTLVHCAAGMSRSPALVMAYLMKFRGASLRQAHALVRDGRPHIRLNRGFWEQLLSYELSLYGNNSVRLADEPDGGGTRPTRVQSSAQSLPHTRGLAQPIPHARGPLPSWLQNMSRGLTTPESNTVPITPTLRRAGPKDNRKCLSQISNSPLMRHNTAVHFGSSAGSRHVSVPK